MSYSAVRVEQRNKAVVAVMLASLDGRLSTERAFTQNISSHGAGVLVKEPWRRDDTLLVKSLEGDFQSEGRVVYREPRGKTRFIIGVELSNSKGQWKRQTRH